MWTTEELILLSLGLCALLLIGIRIFLGYRAAGGKRLVNCPDNGKTVAVEVDPWAAVKDSLSGPLSWKLHDCSRWPEKANCGQECIAQIDAAPGDCLLRNILTSWYRGKRCRDCGKEFGEIHWHDHKPGLLDPKGGHHEWSDFAPETIPDVLKQHWPLCWDCLVTHDFRSRFPELVTDRDFLERDTPAVWKD